MTWTLLLILGSSLTDSTLGLTYHYSSDLMNWTQARRFCQTYYTDLVVIQNQKENDYLVSKLPNKTKSPYYWIGITKTLMNEPWTWVGNNSTWIGEKSWAPNEPNNNHSTEFCVEIYVNSGINRGKWNDEKCSFSKSPACYQAQCNATSCVRGQCQETIENTTCLCEPGFKGDRCQIEEYISFKFNIAFSKQKQAQCNATSCVRGQCQETTENTTCLCEPGFKGDRCQIAQCNATSCVRGQCQETTENTTCLCEPGFKGDRCQTAVECLPLSHPDNGYLLCSGGNQTFNSTCLFKCHTGFLLTGSSALTCEVTGVWSGPRPTCASYKQALMAVAGCGAFSAFCCICFCWAKHRKRKKLAQVRQPEEAITPSSEVQG